MLANLGTPLLLPQTSEIAHLAFHILYHLDFLGYFPTFLQLSEGSAYTPSTTSTSPLLVPSKPFLQHRALSGNQIPTRTFTVAARFNLETLAVGTSKSLLTIPLYAITNERAGEIRPH